MEAGEAADGTKGVVKNSVIGDQHRTWWDDEYKVVMTQIVGEFDESDARGLLKHLFEIKRKFPRRKLNYLIDLSRTEKPSSKAREVIVKQVYSSPMWRKIATFGQSAIIRTINGWMIRASGLKSDKIRMFAGGEDALKWLKS